MQGGCEICYWEWNIWPITKHHIFVGPGSYYTNPHYFWMDGDCEGGRKCSHSPCWPEEEEEELLLALESSPEDLAAFYKANSEILLKSEERGVLLLMNPCKPGEVLVSVSLNQEQLNAISSN